MTPDLILGEPSPKSYLVDSAQGHHQNSHKEISHGQTQDEVISHVLQIPLQNDGSDNKHVSWNQERGQNHHSQVYGS